MKTSELTQGAVYFLMECHERQLLGQQPCNLRFTRHVEKLILGGFIEARTYRDVNGKSMSGFFITQKGIEYLNDEI